MKSLEMREIKNGYLISVDNQDSDWDQDEIFCGTIQDVFNFITGHFVSDTFDKCGESKNNE
jgi:hypothetical protein